MAVTRKARTETAVTAPTPAAKSKAKLTAVPPAAKQLYVELVNGCSTYVTPEREIFYKDKVYPVDSKDLGRMLAYKDDFGRHFFKQCNADAAAIRRERIAAAARADGEESGRNGIAGTVDAVTKEADEEVDTGAMRLQDDDGNEVGVAV